MTRQLFWPGARVFDHRWPGVPGVVTIISDKRVYVHYDNGRADVLAWDDAALRLGRMAAA